MLGTIAVVTLVGVVAAVSRMVVGSCIENQRSRLREDHVPVRRSLDEGSSPLLSICVRQQ
jgi:hypothetical protein